MSKAVLISIRPKWCELIANGKKTIEVRKTRPKIETPFKCYIYQTKTGQKDWQHCGVIGEFVCDRIANDYPDAVDAKKACLTAKEIFNYANGKHSLFLWHITNLVIYDKPKELSEFERPYDCDCCGAKWASECNECFEKRNLKRAPQSWGYVEEVEEC